MVKSAYLDVSGDSENRDGVC